MRSAAAVYALAESALFRFTMYHYVIAVVLLLLLVRLVHRRTLFVRSVSWIPGPSALPLIGNAFSLTGGQVEFSRLLKQYGREYGSIFRLWIGTRIFVFMAKAEDIQPILNSNQHSYKSHEYSFLQDWLGGGLISISGGEVWQRKRKLLTPSFHANILVDYTDAIYHQIDTLLQVLSRKAKTTKPFDVVPYLKSCTLDIICVTAMGKVVGAQLNNNNDYVAAVDELTTILTKRFITPWIKPNLIFKLSSWGRRQAKALRVVDEFVNGVIEAKKKEKKMKSSNELRHGTNGAKGKKAFLDLLLDANDNGADLSDEDIKHEVHTFMFAGHDTTAITVSWCLYVLGKHPDFQDQIVEEYGREVDVNVNIYQQLRNCELLDLCIKEVLRLFPIAPLIARDIRQPVQLPGRRVLPEGTTALIYSPMLHRDPQYFPDPDKFDPQRFSLRNKSNTHPFAYIPFSAGPRNCLGQRFAQMTTKLILVRILETFRVTSVDPEESLNLVSDIILTNKDGINITLVPR